MKVEIKALDYRNQVAETAEVDIDDHSVISVRVVTGDEIVSVFNSKTGDTTCISAGGRLADFYDGEYTVAISDVEAWNQRTNVYDYMYDAMMAM